VGELFLNNNRNKFKRRHKLPTEGKLVQTYNRKVEDPSSKLPTEGD
jgi:hypothetical protein